MSVTFVERPRLYCAACGARAEEQSFMPIRREVWCVNVTCSQHGQRINVFDKVFSSEPLP